MFILKLNDTVKLTVVFNRINIKINMYFTKNLSLNKLYKLQ